MRRTIAHAATLSALAALSGSLVLVGPTPSYAVVTGDDCASITTPETMPSDPPEQPSESLAALQIPRAQEIAQRLSGTVAGTGVRVALIDSGVRTDGVTFFDPTGRRALPSPPELVDNHGTTMAGIIAGDDLPDDDPDIGPVGVAPGAEIFDLRVYDVDNGETASEDQVPLTADRIIAGLTAVLPYVGTGPGDVRIVNISLAVNSDAPGLREAVERVTDRRAIVVASSGNRNDEAYEPGEDVADSRYPAGYAKADDTHPANPYVVAVGTTNDESETGDPVGLLSSAIDVVVPTLGAVSYAYNGSTCVYPASSTSVAAAQVSGILAMMMTVFPRATPLELIARLEATASGGAAQSAIPDRFQGHGIVQPIEALTRRLPPNPRGLVIDQPAREQRAVPAPLPQAEPDLLADTRRNAVWWGLFGGGALVVAMLLRPVLSRRRR